MKRNISINAHGACRIALSVFTLTAVIAVQALAGPINMRRGGDSSSREPSARESQRSDSGSTDSRHSGRTSGTVSGPSDRSSGTAYRPSGRSSSEVPKQDSTSRTGNVLNRSRDRGDTGWTRNRPDTSTSRTDRTGSYRPRTDDRDKYDRSTSRTYRPGDNDRSTSRTYRPDGSDRSTSRTYPGSTSSYDRGRVFNRTGERHTTRTWRDDDRYEHYYSSGYYRPYSGWRHPQYSGGLYYYSWPYQIEPYYYGFYVWNNDSSYACRSAYFYYDYIPYIYRTRVVVEEAPPVYTSRTYVEPYSDDDYYLNRPPGSVGIALDEIRQSWTDDQPGLLLNHIRNNDRILVYLDGRYSYTIDAEDYLSMTRDAFEKVRTISFDFTNIRERSNGDIVAYGRHRYYGSEDEIRTVYVSYTLHNEGGRWFITEVGSAKDPLGY